MNGWRDCKLGEVLNLKRGYDLPHQSRVPGRVPVISSSGVSGHHNEAKVKGPGVVTGRYGTLGEVFFIEEDFWPLNTSLYVQDFKGNDERFIGYFLKQLDLGARNAAGAVPGVNRNHLHAMDVRVPPLPVQRRIVAILSAYEDLIENAERRIKLLTEMAGSIYREWFERPTEKGMNSGVVADIAQLFRESTLPSDFPDQMFEHFSIPAFDAKKLPALEAGAAILSSKFLLTEDAVLFSKLNPRIPRVWLATPTPRVHAVASTEFLVLRPMTELSLEFLFLTLSSPRLLSEVTQGASGTSTSHQRIKPEQLMKTRCARPTAEQCRAFTAAVAPVVGLSQLLTRKVARLRDTRDLLLPRLLSGQLNPTELA